MSDIPKPTNSGMVSNRSFTDMITAFMGFKSPSSVGLGNVASSSSIDGNVHDSNLKRNDTCPGYVGEIVSANSEKAVALESDEPCYGRPPRPKSSTGVREKVTWSFFNRHGQVMEEIGLPSVRASTKSAGPIVDSLPIAQPELPTSARLGMPEGENSLASGTIPQSGEPLPPVKRRCEFFWSIMDESTVANIREINMFIPIST